MIGNFNSLAMGVGQAPISVLRVLFIGVTLNPVQKREVFCPRLLGILVGLDTVKRVRLGEIRLRSGEGFGFQALGFGV